MDPQRKAHILTAFGLADLPQEEQDEMIGKIGSTVFQGVLVRALETMKPKERKELEAKLEEAGGNAEAVLAAMQATIPDFNGLVQEETARLAEESRRILSPDTTA